jgi:F0F1-type ATP synthase assembly protein I
MNLSQAWGAPAVIVGLTLVGLLLGWLVGTAVHARALFVLLGSMAGAGGATFLLYRAVSDRAE